jgi:hypothetical protein
LALVFELQQLPAVELHDEPEQAEAGRIVQRVQGEGLRWELPLTRPVRPEAERGASADEIQLAQVCRVLDTPRPREAVEAV